MLAALFSEGLLLGIGLFAAPGPKDTLVIRQAVAGGAVWGVVVICVLADAVLIALGIAGVGVLLGHSPRAQSALVIAGAVYLVWFGGQRLRASLRNASTPDESGNAVSQRGVLKTAFLLGFANPYAWLDTVVLIGSIGAGKPAAQQVPFAAGTMLASLLWFVALAWGSRRMAWLFKSAPAWRWLDVAIAMLMAYLAIRLLASAWTASAA
ncbi:MAG: LysE family transporter [Thiomonas sp.]|uniref:LysE/ArgO family amino acid transporter n=1 Tax=Thiomonas sp. TaxID=2047785 RepID=UPI002A36FB93|nr:LysE family transporter [Thiomonas sp.]MDY0329338.1 LysE family transporter [Thiomonas sp.]